MSPVDPNVYDLAADFVEDIVADADVHVTEAQRLEYVQRAAEAIQRAVEDECSAIEAELLEPRRRFFVADES
jgi:hypothetical protein